MRAKGKIIRGAAIMAAAAGILATPGTAAAEGGVDPTRYCLQEEVNTYLYDPYSVKTATKLIENGSDCLRYFVAHVANPSGRAAWRSCMLEGLDQSYLPIWIDPFLEAAYRCTSVWLQFEVQVDPNPS